MTFVSYAQNFEDVLLWRALGNIQRGTYIDIGAQDPIVDSVSMAFYERGWRGIHVEPSAHYAEALRAARPDETVVEAAIAEEAGSLAFFEVPGTGLSTADPDVATLHRASFNVIERCVKVMPLDELLETVGFSEVHWMKIDVEGFEREVIRGWKVATLRPWIVIVESTLPRSQTPAHEPWEPLLLDKGYKFAFFDGLNRYYLSGQHLDLLHHFNRPANVFDHFELSGTSSSSFAAKSSRELQGLGLQVQRLTEQLAALRGELDATWQELTSKSEEARQSAQALSVAKEAVSRLGDELTEAKDRIEASELWANALQQRLAAAAASERESRQAAESWRARVRAVESSTSWMITKPLRIFKSLVVGRGILKAASKPKASQERSTADSIQPAHGASGRLSRRAQRAFEDIKAAVTQRSGRA